MPLKIKIENHQLLACQFNQTLTRTNTYLNTQVLQRKDGVAHVSSTSCAFACCHIWEPREGSPGMWRSQRSNPAGGIVDIIRTVASFAALTEDGDVRSWNASRHCEDSYLSTSLNVELVRATHGAFAAFHKKGFATVRGNPNLGGNIALVRSELMQCPTIILAGRADHAVKYWGFHTGILLHTGGGELEHPRELVYRAVPLKEGVSVVWSKVLLECPVQVEEITFHLRCLPIKADGCLSSKREACLGRSPVKIPLFSLGFGSWHVPESDCEGFLLKISCGIRLLIIISSSSSAHHHLIIIIIIIISSSSSHHHHHHHHHHHLIIIIIIIIIIISSSSSFPSLSLAFLFFSILAQPSSHEKRARRNPSQGKCVFRAKKFFFFRCDKGFKPGH